MSCLALGALHSSADFCLPADRRRRACLLRSSHSGAGQTGQRGATLHCEILPWQLAPFALPPPASSAQNGPTPRRCCNIDVSTVTLPSASSSASAAASSDATDSSASASPEVIIVPPTKATTPSDTTTSASSTSTSQSTGGDAGDSNGGRRLRDYGATTPTSSAGSSGSSSKAASAAGSKASSAASTKAAADCAPGDTTDICAQAAEIAALPTCTVRGPHNVGRGGFFVALHCMSAHQRCLQLVQCTGLRCWACKAGRVGTACAMASS